jgi:hypothetical protein
MDSATGICQTVSTVFCWRGLSTAAAESFVPWFRLGKCWGLGLRVLPWLIGTLGNGPGINREKTRFHQSFYITCINCSYLAHGWFLMSPRGVTVSNQDSLYSSE